MIGSVLRIRYELVSPIADGAIFSAFLARDRVANREVTVRLLKPPFNTERSFIDALANSIRQTANVSHPGVERVDELDEDDARVFLVGPHSPGLSLTERLHKLAPFSVPVSVGTAISICEGLDALHSAGVVHGDVSSHNVVVAADGSTRLQLAGIWRAYSHSSTAGSVVLPTLAAYLAPEISAGGLPSTTSDVYAVGVLLYELLCGRLPYAAETPVAMAMKHATAPTPSIRTYCPSAPMVLDEIVKRAMQKDPTLRYRNAGALLSDLRLLQDALRFGRSLTWPLRAEAPTAQTPSSKGRFDSRVEPPVQPVAPRMSAIDRKPRKPPREDDGDVPQWLKYSILALGMLIVGGLTVWLFSNLHGHKNVTVPNLVGRDLTEARQALKVLGLDLREIRRESSDTVPAQAIVSSDPDSGEKVHENGVVSVIVSSGPKQVEVPTLQGLALDQAKLVLSKLDLKLDPTVDRVADAANADTVVDQTPKPHEFVEKHATVRVRVSTGTPAPAGSEAAPGAETDNSTKPPTSNGDDIGSLYSFKIKLSDALTAVTVRVDMTDAHGTQTLFQEPHEVNDVIPIDAKGYGNEVQFKVYYDDRLMHTYTRHPAGTNRRRRRQAPQPTTPAPDDKLGAPDDNPNPNPTDQ